MSASYKSILFPSSLSRFLKPLKSSFYSSRQLRECSFSPSGNKVYRTSISVWLDEFLFSLSLFFYLDAFAKLRKATISSVMPVRPSVCPHGTTQLLPDGFSLNLIFIIFRNTVEEIGVLLQSDKNNGHFT